MPNELEKFLCLSGLAWSAISSIATVIAVIVALFLPFHYEKKKKRNLSKLIENEIESNNNLLIKADQCKDGNFNGATIFRLNLMCSVLVNIDYSVWSDNKQTIAEISAERFLQYSEIVKLLGYIKMHAIEIIEKKGLSPYAAMINDEVKLCIKLIEK